MINMDSNNMTFNQALVFAIMMQHGARIMSKSPDYLMEKLELCLQVKDLNLLRNQLDAESRELLADYLVRWGKGLPK